MRARHVLAAALPLGFTLGALASCESHTCLDDHSCLSPGDAGAAADATFDAASSPADASEASVTNDGAADAPPGCDKTKGPSEGACVVDESLGVFVAPQGSDTDGLGTRAAPVQTIGKAVALAASKGLGRVYACSAEYAENLVVTGSAALSLFGGLTCPGDAGAAWSVAPQTVATVHPAAGYALHVDTVTAALHVEDFAFAASDATAPGASSIGAFVASSPSVSFTRVTFTAGKAVAPGADGATPSTPLPVAKAGLNGSDVPDGGAGAERTVTCQCPNGVASVGGAGGTAGNAGSPGKPDLGGGMGGLAQTVCGNANSGSGGNGAAGAAAAPLPAVSSTGTVSSAGWQPAPGQTGLAGGTGQGGGGGNGQGTSGVGGTGGCGGCGGAAATGGQGGAASIALVSFQSSVSLQASVLVAGDAGNGGKGAAGQAGGGGATGGNGFNGCGGGAGGAGGLGAPSGGGAGGISAGIVSWGTPPTVDAATTFTLGKPGVGGAGGAAGNAGVDGVARETLAL